MGAEFTSDTCFTCSSKKPINFHKVSDSCGDLELNICHIICQHFWFKEDDLQNVIVCETCWEKVDQFHQFYLDVKKHQENREVAPLSMFIKQEEITIEETQLQEYCVETTAMNHNLFDVADCKHEMPGEFDKLLEKEEPSEVPLLGRKRKYTKRLKIKRVVKRSNPHSRKPLILKERQDEDDFIKQHTRYICDECNIEFENFRAIKKHRMEAHNKNSVVCCGNQHISRARLYQHVQSLLNPEAFKCEICGKSFTLKQAYVRHKELYHADEDDLVFKCNRCSKSFIKEGLLKSHLAEHTTLENETAKCEFCGKCFRHKLLLDKHVKDVHKKPMDFICEVCSKGFYRRAMLLVHRKTHELTTEQLKEQCPVCSKWLKNHTIWLQHMRRHKAGECKCEVCGHVSINMISLKVHMRRNHGPTNKQLVCEWCGKEYSRADILKEHVANVHTRENLFQCQHCEKKFFSRPNMNSHRKKDHPQEWLKHASDRKRHVCERCGKEYSRAIDLKEHVANVHTREHLYQCQHCEKKFFSRLNVNSHIKKEHPQEWLKYASNRKKHVCEHCGKEYSRAIYLKEHVANVHTKEHLYQCKHCEKKFFSRNNMMSHRRKDHP